MAICAKCGGDFQSKHNGKAPRCCYECSPFEGKRGRGEHLPEESVPAELLCIKCEVVQPKADFYRYANNAPHQWCKPCVRSKAVESQRRFKLECISYKGGVCVDCDKMPHPAAMDFHHLEPEAKDFRISAAGTKTLNAKVRGELDKCVLVCKNCHAIRHAKWDGELEGDGTPGS